MKQRTKQRLKKAPSKGFFICWCTEKKAFDSLSELRTHQKTTCSINLDRLLNELTSSLMKAKRKAPHEADLALWEKEKACGVPKVSNRKEDLC